MTDFVTRLETELREAALRRERAGVVRAVALPRMRLALGQLPTAALAIVLLGLALAGAAILLASSPERAAQGKLPAALRGTWRAGPTELRLYPDGSTRCVNLGLESSEPCYTIGSADTGVAQEWGRLSVAGDELTLRALVRGDPGLYRWRVQGRTLALIKVRDGLAARSKALGEPLTHFRARHRQVPIGADWTARSFTSERYGYSMRYPNGWSVASRGQADRFSKDPARAALPFVTVAAQDLAPGTTAARWTVIVESVPGVGCAYDWYRRISVDGEAGRVTTYRSCNGTAQQWASFVHGGRGYRVVWRGKIGTNKAAGPLFDALLRSVVFLR